MRYRAWLGLAAIAVGAWIAASCAPAVYDNDRSSRVYDVNDFNGEWQLVSARSDNGRSWLDERSRYDNDRDDWDNGNGTVSGTTNTPMYGAWFLPDDFRISGDRQSLQIDDSSGQTMAQVSFDDVSYGSYNRDQYDQGTVHAHWLSNRRFQVDRYGRNGRHILQTFMLQNRGRQLVVNTEVDRDGGMRTFTRVYERV